MTNNYKSIHTYQSIVKTKGEDLIIRQGLKDKGIVVKITKTHGGFQLNACIEENCPLPSVVIDSIKSVFPDAIHRSMKALFPIELYDCKNNVELIRRGVERQIVAVMKMMLEDGSPC